MFLAINMTPVFTVLFLVFLEGLLSLDNALVLAMMVRYLPPAQRKKALTYGIYGAFAFRAVTLFALNFLMAVWWLKAIGGLYLIFIALKYYFGINLPKNATPAGSFIFWRTVVAVEVMDMAFSVDSILAAISVSQSYVIILIGGILGIIMMRVAANSFVWLLEKFPRLEATAYWLVSIIGSKLLIQSLDIPGVDFHAQNSPYAWAFWTAMGLAILSGLRPTKAINTPAEAA